MYASWKIIGTHWRRKIVENKPLMIITGGTSGIGFELAQFFLKEFNLALIFKNNIQKAKHAEEILKSSGALVKIYQELIIDDCSASRVTMKIKDDFHQTPYILINCAGDTKMDLFLNTTHDDVMELFSSHVLGMMALTRIVSEDMYGQRAGKIFTFSSIASQGDEAGYSLYCSAKSAVEGFTKSIANELIHRKVTVNCIRPGIVKLPNENLEKHSDKTLVEPIEICRKIETLIDENENLTTGKIFTIL